MPKAPLAPGEFAVTPHPQGPEHLLDRRVRLHPGSLRSERPRRAAAQTRKPEPISRRVCPGCPPPRVRLTPPIAPATISRGSRPAELTSLVPPVADIRSFDQDEEVSPPTRSVCLRGARSRRRARGNDASKRTKIIELLSILKVDKVGNQIVDGASQQTEALGHREFGATETADQQKQVTDLRGKVVGLMTQAVDWKALQPEFITLYNNAYSEQELDGILTFYKSPSGQALLNKGPEIRSEVQPDRAAAHGDGAAAAPRPRPELRQSGQGRPPRAISPAVPRRLRSPHPRSSPRPWGRRGSIRHAVPHHTGHERNRGTSLVAERHHLSGLPPLLSGCVGRWRRRTSPAIETPPRLPRLARRRRRLALPHLSLAHGRLRL